ncbi:uncharacterized protein GGS25DRAFT_454076 [Hypoxylon fragiforme]|uniref:uncharacterized protein n=1 Tax=Hypoxylon fragiforme TaxID=63214 RepID=UPI0020C6C5E1|nr:uncharacterized protein GGS25DRAFT_454076 [Hypoxylon fragiforme]KAI2604274.1 hypothetical protein GGS25DRAFT_454076 [Hypoxylon fragiforme]
MARWFCILLSSSLEMQTHLGGGLLVVFFFSFSFFFNKQDLALIVTGTAWTHMVPASRITSIWNNKKGMVIFFWLATWNVLKLSIGVYGKPPTTLFFPRYDKRFL